MDLSTCLTVVIIAQGFYVFVVLFIGEKNRHANKFLSLLVLASSLWLLDSYFRISGAYMENPNLYFVPIFYSFGIGPLLYFYTRAITKKEFTFKKDYLLHFVPVILQGVAYFILFFASYSYKRWFWLEVHRPYTYDLEFNLTFVSLAIYSFLSIRMIVRYQKWIKSQFSEISKVHLNWLKWLQYGLICICAFWLAEAILREVFVIYAQQPISALTLSISILFLSTAGILQADVFRYAVERNDEEEVLAQSGSVDLLILNQISSVMEKEQYFLDPELTLSSFSSYLGLPSRQVSYHINKGLKTTFIDFVNTYRVNLVKDRIKSEAYSHLTLNGIALESGFNSNSTFNRVFKNITGETPSFYKNNNS